MANSSNNKTFACGHTLSQPAPPKHHKASRLWKAIKSTIGAAVTRRKLRSPTRKICPECNSSKHTNPLLPFTPAPATTLPPQVCGEPTIRRLKQGVKIDRLLNKARLREAEKAAKRAERPSDSWKASHESQKHVRLSGPTYYSRHREANLGIRLWRKSGSAPAPAEDVEVEVDATSQLVIRDEAEYDISHSLTSLVTAEGPIAELPLSASSLRTRSSPTSSVPRLTLSSPPFVLPPQTSSLPPASPSPPRTRSSLPPRPVGRQDFYSDLDSDSSSPRSQSSPSPFLTPLHYPHHASRSPPISALYSSPVDTLPSPDLSSRLKARHHHGREDRSISPRENDVPGLSIVAEEEQEGTLSSTGEGEEGYPSSDEIEEDADSPTSSVFPKNGESAVDSEAIIDDALSLLEDVPTPEIPECEEQGQSGLGLALDVEVLSDDELQGDESAVEEFFEHQTPAELKNADEISISAELSNADTPSTEAEETNIFEDLLVQNEAASIPHSSNEDHQPGGNSTPATTTVPVFQSDRLLIWQDVSEEPTTAAKLLPSAASRQLVHHPPAPPRAAIHHFDPTVESFTPAERRLDPRAESFTPGAYQLPAAEDVDYAAYAIDDGNRYYESYPPALYQPPNENWEQFPSSQWQEYPSNIYHQQVSYPQHHQPQPAPLCQTQPLLNPYNPAGKLLLHQIRPFLSLPATSTPTQPHRTTLQLTNPWDARGLRVEQPSWFFRPSEHDWDFRVWGSLEPWKRKNEICDAVDRVRWDEVVDNFDEDGDEWVKPEGKDRTTTTTTTSSIVPRYVPHPYVRVIRTVAQIKPSEEKLKHREVKPSNLRTELVAEVMRAWDDDGDEDEDDGW